MSVDLSAVRGIKGCGKDTPIGPAGLHGVVHGDAIRWASLGCAACLSLLVEGIVALERDAIRREAFEEAARVCEQPASTSVCGGTGTIPAASVNEIVAFALRLTAKGIRALAGGKEEG